MLTPASSLAITLLLAGAEQPRRTRARSIPQPLPSTCPIRRLGEAIVRPQDRVDGPSHVLASMPAAVAGAEALSINGPLGRSCNHHWRGTLVWRLPTSRPPAVNRLVAGSNPARVATENQMVKSKDRRHVFGRFVGWGYQGATLAMAMRQIPSISDPRRNRERWVALLNASRRQRQDGLRLQRLCGNPARRRFTVGADRQGEGILWSVYQLPRQRWTDTAISLGRTSPLRRPPIFPSRTM